MASPPPPKTLTIAGSDSGGGAGIQADLKTFTALGTYGLSVITALTSQNTLGVDGVVAVNPPFVSKQLRAVIDDIGVDTIKIGMLHNHHIIEAVAETLTALFPPAGSSKLPPIVLDPVMISTSEHVLLDPSSLPALKTHLLPLCTLVTPNIAEAKKLSSLERIDSVEDMKAAAKKISELGSHAVLVKGGHLDERQVYDVLYETANGEYTVFEHPRIHTKNTHGTGCTQSSAIAAFLSKGNSLREAIQLATDYVQAALLASFDIGHGSGPLNHLVAILPRALAAPSDLDPHPFTSYLIRSCAVDWTMYTRKHPFILGLKDGTLPRESFIHFLKQDYIFLTHYARIHALAAYKSFSMEEIDAATDIVKHIVRESKHHIAFCQSWGISLEEFHSTPESGHTVAYTRYVLDTGVSNSLLALRVATAPCLLGYGDVGTWLHDDPGTKREGNAYWPWIEGYAGEDFQKAVRKGRDLLEESVKANPLSPAQLAEMVNIFRKATRLEVGFWEQSWSLQ
ncbi:phosphomethylpyrimidine kinase [Dacryopinax primogenitus]|uniref:Phosphomethylpyrimidine kinase n=1 Tax=Dacryopinax primogenitus (strain DJM 731) TaxID=1858805 RepID=M5FX76_DACPD|nr:phosphomethylpyrimidine kinase [Dacryopinax primogenitus]EJU02586.1 phosphomethylpyrimidine kinase [Dacryopinax primogenitus]